LPGRLDLVAQAFVALYLASLLAVPGVSTSLAALACLTALAAGFHQWSGDARAGLPHMAVLAVPATFYLLHVLLQMLLGVASTRLGSHVLIGLLCLAVGLSGVPDRSGDVRRWILPAAAVGAVGTCLLALYQFWFLGYLRPYGWLGGGSLGNGAIKFGDLAALQALLAFVLVLTGTRRFDRLLGLAGLFSGVLALALTQTRGGVLGFLIAVGVLGLALALRRAHREAAVAPLPAVSPGAVRTRWGTSAAMLVFALVLLLSAAFFMQDRFAAIGPQVQRFLDGDLNSEVGQRLALWQAALRAGLHEPLTGIGFGRFAEELARQTETGQLSGTGRILYGQAHSEYLAAFSQAGVTGFLALLLMFIAPVVALLRQIRRGQGSPAAYAALVSAAAFSGFALTDDMFDRQITVIAFFFLNAWFLRAAMPPAAAGALRGPLHR